MSNAEALKHYDVKKYRTPNGYTADIAIFTIQSIEKETSKPPVMDLKIMLIKRSMQDTAGRPNIEAGKWALPEDFINYPETAFVAGERELEEETAITLDFAFARKIKTLPFIEELEGKKHPERPRSQHNYIFKDVEVSTSIYHIK